MRALILCLLAGQLGAATNKLNPPIQANPVYLTAPAQAQVWVDGAAVSTTNPVPVTAPQSGSLPIRVTAPVAVVPTDSAGHAYESLNPFNGHYYQGVGIVQDVHGSTLNSTVANLAANASFTGTAESTLGIAGIQVCAFSDQTLTVRVQQSYNGTGWYWEHSFTVFSLSGTCQTIQALSQYYRVIALNSGGATSTTCTVQVALCPVVEAVPPYLTQNGNLRVGIMEFKNRVDKVTNSIAVTWVAETTLLAAQGDRTYTDMSHVIVANEGNQTNTVRFRDSTAGTVQFAVDVAAGTNAIIPFGTALWPQSVSNTPWTIQLSVSPTGGTNALVRISALGFKVRQ